MSNFKKLTDIVQEVITELSMYRGTGTQKYAEDRIANKIVRNFDDIIDQRFWSFNTKWHEFNLVGENGYVAENVSNIIKDFNDIETISSDINPRYALKRLHDSTNPYKVQSTYPLYYHYSDNPDKIFQIVPYNCTGKIYVRAKTRPVKFYPDTIVPFDANYLVYKTCYDYCCDDGNSDLQVQKYQQLFTERLSQIMRMHNDQVINYNDENAYYPNNEWR